MPIKNTEFSSVGSDNHPQEMTYRKSKVQTPASAVFSSLSLGYGFLYKVRKKLTKVNCHKPFD